MPDEILLQLNRKRNVKRSDVYFIPPGALLPKKKSKHPYLLFFTLKDMRRNGKFLDKYADRIILVFDSPIALSTYQMNYMDFKVGTDLHIDGFECTGLDWEREVVEYPFERSDTDLVRMSVEEVKAQRTVLNQLMTFIYSLPNSTHQTPVKATVCGWMGSRNTIQHLIKTLKANRDCPMSDKQYARLADILTSETALIYRNAMREGGDSEDLARRYGISAFEINYMRAVSDAAK